MAKARKAKAVAVVANVDTGATLAPADTGAPVNQPQTAPVEAPATITAPVAPVWDASAMLASSKPQPAAQAATPVVPGAAPVTPVAQAYAARATTGQGGATVQARVTGTMARTLAALVQLGATSETGAVTHAQLAAHTGHHKGNKLRELYALGYTHTSLGAGTRGYVYHATAAGVAALGAAPVAPVAAPKAPAVDFGALANTAKS